MIEKILLAILNLFCNHKITITNLLHVHTIQLVILQRKAGLKRFQIRSRFGTAKSLNEHLRSENFSHTSIIDFATQNQMLKYTFYHIFLHDIAVRFSLE